MESGQCCPIIQKGSRYINTVAVQVFLVCCVTFGFEHLSPSGDRYLNITFISIAEPVVTSICALITIIGRPQGPWDGLRIITLYDYLLF